MNKEIEAIQVLKANAILFDDGSDYGASMLEAIEVLDKYLTPPTEQEVCEALSKHYHSVWYKKNEDDFIYLGGKFLQNEYIITLDKLKQRGLYEEIILMAKFYKGKVKK